METVFDMASINYPYGVLHDQKLKSVSNEDNKFIFTFELRFLRRIIMTKKFMKNIKTISTAI